MLTLAALLVVGIVFLAYSDNESEEKLGTIFTVIGGLLILWLLIAGCVQLYKWNRERVHMRMYQRKNAEIHPAETAA